jgi:O-antigen/teichoic acid export membrane protein
MIVENTQFLKNSLNTLAIDIVILVVSIITSVITARILGPEGRGQLSLLILIPTLCVTFGRIGVGHAVNYYASKIPPTDLIVNSSAISITISFLLVVFLFGATKLFEDFFRKVGSGGLIWIMIFSLPFYLFNNLFFGLLQGFYKIRIRNLLNLSQSLLTIALLLTLLFIFDFGLPGALISYVLALTAIVIFSAYYFLPYFNKKNIIMDFTLIKKLLNFGFKSHIGNVLKDLSYRSDILIIGYYLTTTEIGYYVVAITIAEIVWKIPDAVGTVLLPRIAQMNQTSAKLFTPIVCRTILIATFFCCIGLGFLCQPIIKVLFGLDFLPSVPAAILMLPGIWFLSIWKILANDLIAQGFTIKYSVSSAVSFFVMIFLDLLLIPFLGINGAAIASSISYLAATATIVYFYCKISNNSIRILLCPQRSDYNLYKLYFRGA